MSHLSISPSPPAPPAFPSPPAHLLLPNPLMTKPSPPTSEQAPEQLPESVSLWRPLANRNFRLLTIGESVSNLGDQFYFVALPWLTLQLTGSPLDLGVVLMVVAIPRAILMILGGALSDRFSPRIVMLTSNLLRAGLTAILATLTALQATQLWHLYLLAFSFGVIEGFFSPAAEAIVPTLVSEEQLVASNVLGQSTNQLILLIGPALAGGVIVATGVGTAFVIDAVSFVISTVALWLIQQRPVTPVAYGVESGPELSATPPIASDDVPALSLMAGISEGLRYSWRNRSLRTVFLALAALNFLFIGPLQVGIATLANERFPAGALALGVMTSAWGAGGLLGTLLPQWLPRLPRLGVLMLVLASLQGAGMVLLGILLTLPLASLTIAILGGCSSFFVLVGTTWIQKTTPPEILGRVMGIGLLSSIGVAPFSYALAGILASVNPLVLFAGTGMAMLAVNIMLAVNPVVRTLE